MIGIVAPLGGARSGSAVSRLRPGRSGPTKTSPGPTKGRSAFWAYGDGGLPLPMTRGSLGGRLHPVELRRLGNPALALWRWLLATRGYTLRPIVTQLATAALDCALPYRTAKRALARLRDAGVVDCRVSRERLSSGAWASTLRVTTYGAADPERGRDVYWAPACTIEWCRRAPSWGGHRVALRGQDGPSDFDPPTRRQGVTEQVGPPLNSEIWDQGQGLSDPNPNLPGGRPEGITVPRAQTTPPPPTVMTRISTPSVRTLPLVINPEDLPSTQVRLVVQAYNLAVDQVYAGSALPRGRRVYLPADSAKSKLYPRLLDAAARLIEHSIPPLAWAVWCLEHDRSLGRGPGQIYTIFAANRIHKQRGHWRATSQHDNMARLQVGDVQREQLFRKQEAQKLAKGCPLDRARFLLPTWYQDLRQREIDRGITDPATNYPTAR